MRSVCLPILVCVCVVACGTNTGRAGRDDSEADAAQSDADAQMSDADSAGSDVATTEDAPDNHADDADAEPDDSGSVNVGDTRDDDGSSTAPEDTGDVGATDALPTPDAEAEDSGADSADGSGDSDAAADAPGELPCTTQEGFLDEDLDGFGGIGARGCLGDEGFVVQGGDCNDADDTIYPGAPELCDGLDNDCDGQLDESDTGIATWADADNDTWGDPDTGYLQCAATPGRVLRAGDCDDRQSLANPGLAEISCDGIDNDCDGQADSDGCSFELWVETPARPWFMLVDPTSTWLYWTDNVSSVYRAPLDSPADFELVTNRASRPRNLWIDETSSILLVADAQGVLRGPPEGGTFTRIFSHGDYGSNGLAALFGVSGTCTGDYSRALLWREHLIIGLGSGNCGPIIVVEPDGTVRPVSDPNVVGEWVTVHDDTLYYGRPVCRLASPDASPECFGSDLSMAGFQLDDTMLYAARRDGIYRWPLDDPSAPPTALETWTECGFGFYQTNLALEQGRLFALDPCSSSVFAVNTDGTGEGPIAGTPACMIAMVSTPGNLYVSECGRSRISRLRVPRLVE